MLKMFKKLKMFKMLKMYTSTCSALSGISQGTQGSGLFQTAQGGPGGLPRAAAAFTSQSRAMWPCPAQPSLTQPCLAVQGTRECAQRPGSFKEPPQASRGKPGHVQAMWRAMLPMTVTSHPGLSEGLGSLLCCLGDCEVRPQSLRPLNGSET